MGNINMARPVFVHIVLLSVLIISVNCQLNQMCFHNKEQQLGKCVLLRNCPQAIEILNSDELPQTCGFDKGHPIVCCPEKKETSVGPRVDGGTTVPSSSNSKTLRKCDEYAAALKNLISDNPNTNIIGGENASLGEFPHMAALGYGTLDNIQWSCGGTLISDRFVMTAGHCLKGVLGDVKFVQLGDVRLDGASGTHKDFLVSERYPHPEYKPPATYHDIGLIRLNERVIFNVNIKPACLFTEPNFKSVEKYSFQATGWGLTQYLGSPSNILQKVTLQLSEDCNNKYEPNARRLPTGINSRAQFCAGSPLGNDTCTGDSGGPLQIWYFDKRLYCAVGITSFGKVCGTPGLPAVYTRIASYTPWIESIVWPND